MPILSWFHKYKTKWYSFLPNIIKLSVSVAISIITKHFSYGTPINADLIAYLQTKSCVQHGFNETWQICHLENLS